MIKQIKQKILTNKGVVDIFDIQPGDWVFDAIDGSSIVIADKITEPCDSEFKIIYSDGSEFIYAPRQSVITKYTRSKSGMQRSYYSTCISNTIPELLSRLSTIPIERTKYKKFETDSKDIIIGMDNTDFYLAGALLMYGWFSTTIANISTRSNYAPLESYIDATYSWHLEPDNGFIVIKDRFGKPVTWDTVFTGIGYNELYSKDDIVESAMNRFVFCNERQRMSLIRSIVDAGFYYRPDQKYDSNQLCFNIRGNVNPEINHAFCRILYSMGIVGKIVYDNGYQRIHFMSGRIGDLVTSEHIQREFGDAMCYYDAKPRAKNDKSIFIEQFEHLPAYEGDSFELTRLIPYGNTDRCYLSGNLLPLVF